MDFKDGVCRILLDIDGVMADFTSAMCSIMDIRQDDELRKRLETSNWVTDFVDAEEFTKRISATKGDWWSNIPLTPWANSLYAKLTAVAPVAFLTAPHTDDPYSAAGKTMWIKKHFNTDLFLIGKPKYYCAMERSILVDDYCENIRHFVDAGGLGYLWPNSELLKNSCNWEVEVDKTMYFVKGAIKAFGKR